MNSPGPKVWFEYNIGYLTSISIFDPNLTLLLWRHRGGKSRQNTIKWIWFGKTFEMMCRLPGCCINYWSYDFFPAFLHSGHTVRSPAFSFYSPLPPLYKYCFSFIEHALQCSVKMCNNLRNVYVCNNGEVNRMEA